MIKQLCVYVEGQTGIIDTIKNETGLTSIYSKSIADVKKDYATAEIVPLDYAVERINEALKEVYPMLNPIEITEEQFYEMFECLPPMQLNTYENGMTFKMSEMTFGDITSGYVKIGNRFFTMNCRIKTKSEEMLAVCK